MADRPRLLDLPRRFVQLALGPRLRVLLLLSRGRLAFWRPGWLAWTHGGDTRVLRVGPLVAYWRAG